MSEKLHDLIPPDQRGFYTTLNQMGFMLSEIDPYVADFIVKAPSPFLDIGCAFGKSILYALQLGKQVIANDLDQRHLEHLQAQVSIVHRGQIQYQQACFPQTLDFESGSLGSVLASRILHFLTGPEIMTGCQQVHQWLKKDGLFCITSETPYRQNLKEFIPVFEDRKKKGDPFPGLVDDIEKYWPTDHQNLPSWINFLDEDSINCALEKTGFEIVFSQSYRRVIELDHMLGAWPNFFISIGRKA